MSLLSYLLLGVCLFTLITLLLGIFKQSIKTLVMVLLFVISALLVTITLPFAIVYEIIYSALKMDRKTFVKEVGKFYLGLAISLDVLCNVSLDRIFNFIFITSEATHIFGYWKETISSVLGKNQRDGKLTFTGKAMCWVLDSLDKGHCEKSIDNNVVFLNN